MNVYDNVLVISQSWKSYYELSTNLLLKLLLYSSRHFHMYNNNISRSEISLAILYGLLGTPFAPSILVLGPKTMTIVNQQYISCTYYYILKHYYIIWLCFFFLFSDSGKHDLYKNDCEFFYSAEAQLHYSYPINTAYATQMCLFVLIPQKPTMTFSSVVLLPAIAGSP